MKIAVIGAGGFVGQALCKEVLRCQYELIPIYRKDDMESMIDSSYIVIHAANPGRRFWAENNPEKDFFETVEKTYKIYKILRKQKLVLVSSISARTQLNTVYGRNRCAAEMIVDSPNTLIVRLGPMFSVEKTSGPLHDILNNKTVYVSGNTSYSYVPVEYNARKIIEFVKQTRTGVIETGARNSIKLTEIRDQLGSVSTFEGLDDTQIPLTLFTDAPDAYDVISFAKSIQMKETVNE